MASAERAVVSKPVTVFVRHRWVGRAFTRADDREWLPGYAVADVRVRASVRAAGVDYEVQFAIDNLLDRYYVVMPQYPMPGRSLLLSLGFEL